MRNICRQKNRTH